MTYNDGVYPAASLAYCESSNLLVSARFLLIIVFMVFSLPFTASCMATTLVNVVHAGEPTQARLLAKTLEATPGITLKSTDITSEPIPLADIYIAAGPSALRILSNHRTKSPVLATIISRLDYDAIMSKSSLVAAAVLSDPSIDLQLQLIGLLIPNRASAGIILSNQSDYLIGVVAALGKAYGVDVNVVKIGSADDLGTALRRVSKSSALLAVPDSVIYNPDTLSTILLTSYRHEQLVIGFSPGMVRAGAAASIFYSIDDIGYEVGQMLSEYLSTKRLPVPRYPRRFDIALNERVFKSLNIPIEDKSLLLNRLRRNAK